MVLLPTPPFPLATAIILPTPGNPGLWDVCANRCAARGEKERNADLLWPQKAIPTAFNITKPNEIRLNLLSTRYIYPKVLNQ
jgi:hypothetical protein